MCITQRIYEVLFCKDFSFLTYQKNVKQMCYVFLFQTLVTAGLSNAKVEIAGLSNTYSDYVSTIEEYGVS